MASAFSSIQIVGPGMPAGDVTEYGGTLTWKHDDTRVHLSAMSADDLRVLAGLCLGLASRIDGQVVGLHAASPVVGVTCHSALCVDAEGGVCCECGYSDRIEVAL